MVDFDKIQPQKKKVFGRLISEGAEEMEKKNVYKEMYQEFRTKCFDEG